MQNVFYKIAIWAFCFSLACLSEAKGGDATQPLIPQASPTNTEIKPSSTQEKKIGALGLPLPRFVSLKAQKGNARRGPSLTHKIDWVFARRKMPLLITAEYEHWRKVQDFEGFGGWIHYALLSGVRSVIIVDEQVDCHRKPDHDSQLSFRANRGVIARLLKCNETWCKIAVDGHKGWAPVDTLWGIDEDDLKQ